MSYRDSDIIVTSSVNSGNSVEGSIFHSPMANVDAGVRFSYNRGSSDTTFELAGAYNLDSATTVKATVNKEMALGLAYTQTLRKGVTLGLSADVRRLREFGCGWVGLGWTGLGWAGLGWTDGVISIWN